ncbi:hypothetical protein CAUPRSCDRAFT_12059 [Caulochytrium protostelioides]|uniref:Uncharacterized protein n=1 Tax=Caulochytrium protostelioides TaxID=1555241 RepID=A0A4P9WVS6_9FUNG|nr:hypothetical protein CAUPRSCDRAFT_12059 [Caulochytrium protostelioides]
MLNLDGGHDKQRRRRTHSLPAYRPTVIANDDFMKLLQDLGVATRAAPGCCGCGHAGAPVPDGLACWYGARRQFSHYRRSSLGVGVGVVGTRARDPHDAAAPRALERDAVAARADAARDAAVRDGACPGARSVAGVPGRRVRPRLASPDDRGAGRDDVASRDPAAAARVDEAADAGAGVSARGAATSRGRPRVRLLGRAVDRRRARDDHAVAANRSRDGTHQLGRSGRDVTSVGSVGPLGRCHSTHAGGAAGGARCALAGGGFSRGPLAAWHAAADPRRVPPQGHTMHADKLKIPFTRVDDHRRPASASTSSMSLVPAATLSSAGSPSEAMSLPTTATTMKAAVGSAATAGAAADHEPAMHTADAGYVYMGVGWATVSDPTRDGWDSGLAGASEGSVGMIPRYVVSQHRRMTILQLCDWVTQMLCTAAVLSEQRFLPFLRLAEAARAYREQESRHLRAHRVFRLELPDWYSDTTLAVGSGHSPTRSARLQGPVPLRAARIERCATLAQCFRRCRCGLRVAVCAVHTVHRGRAQPAHASPCRVAVVVVSPAKHGGPRDNGILARLAWLDESSRRARDAANAARSRYGRRPAGPQPPADPDGAAPRAQDRARLRCRGHAAGV